MNLPTELIEDIKTYLRDRANQDDQQAQNLLQQIEEAQTKEAEIMPIFYSIPATGEELGC
ncbi:MAG: hypothetical protein SAJ12_19915 [Jaaginema sp. PMC 1079.18]|nr:hypothetical protein [Jaaginema sp. PMC 1080.18]MEC4853254.1 hypothetical protein [Jaaginema sp. PMC 1079.18]MEC4868057.1 hypothetical protein [Jaaginema sp. PMC 1078.18]